MIKPGEKNGSRKTQCERLLAAFEAAPYDAQHPGGRGKWLSVPAIMALGIAQYNARIFDLRRAGYVIKCWKEWNETEHRYHSAYHIERYPVPGKEK
jgi:hypothetical protein